jgi:hypothetical protein
VGFAPRSRANLSPRAKPESRHLESTPKASARLVIEVSARWSSASSRALWGGDALPSTGWKPAVSPIRNQLVTCAHGTQVIAARYVQTKKLDPLSESAAEYESAWWNSITSTLQQQDTDAGNIVSEMESRFERSLTVDQRVQLQHQVRLLAHEQRRCVALRYVSMREPLRRQKWCSGYGRREGTRASQYIPLGFPYLGDVQVSGAC